MWSLEYASEVYCLADNNLPDNHNGTLISKGAYSVENSGELLDQLLGYDRSRSQIEIDLDEEEME